MFEMFLTPGLERVLRERAGRGDASPLTGMPKVASEAPPRRARHQASRAGHVELRSDVARESFYVRRKRNASTRTTRARNMPSTSAGGFHRRHLG